MDEQRHITINFDQLLEIAMKGVRRTAVFLGLGVNAANDESFKSYELISNSSMQFIPSDLDDGTIQHFKTEFGLWIVGCGLRELIETFAVFLDSVHAACLMISAVKGHIAHNVVSESQESFTKAGLWKKLELLKENFEIRTTHPEYLVSINQGRHCLTHRQGIVGPEDCASGQLTMRWLGFEFFAETPTGEVPFHLPLIEGVLLPEGGTLCLRFVERQRTFNLGEVIKLSCRELGEIIYFAMNCSAEVNSAALAYADKMGIQRTSPPTA